MITLRPRLFALLAAVLTLCVGCGEKLHNAPPRGEYMRILRSAEANYEQEDFLHAVGRIAAWLREKAPKVAAMLQPGLSDAQIDATLKQAGFNYELPSDIRTLYRWHNGMPRGSDVPFVGSFRLISLEEALEIATGDTLAKGFGLPAGSLPLLAAPEVYYYARCETRARKAVPLMLRIRGEPIAKMRHVSLTALFLTWGESQGAGGVAIDPDTGVQTKTNDHQWANIQARHSPELMH